MDDPLVWHGGVKAGWAKEMFDAQSEIATGVSSITLPFITIHGTGDTLVDISSSQFLYDNAKSEDKSFEVRKFILYYVVLTALLEYFVS